MAKVLTASYKRSVWKFSHLVIIFVVLVISGMAFLAMLRGDSSQLDTQIVELQRQLRAYEKESRVLEKEISALLYPRSVQDFVVASGMSKVHIAGTVGNDGLLRYTGTATAGRFSQGKEL